MIGFRGSVVKFVRFEQDSASGLSATRGMISLLEEMVVEAVEDTWVCLVGVLNALE